MTSELHKRELFRGSNLTFTVGHGLDGLGEPKGNASFRPGERWLLKWKIPTWQRESVWTREQDVRLIESIWMGLPIATYVYNRVNFSKHPLNEVLVDGQQRWTALDRYHRDEFSVYGYKWSELTELDQRDFFMRPFPCIETKLSDEGKLRDVYERLAYGGTPHPEKPKDYVGSKGLLG